jgi:hypothetical protein
MWARQAVVSEMCVGVGGCGEYDTRLSLSLLTRAADSVPLTPQQASCQKGAE